MEVNRKRDQMIRDEQRRRQENIVENTKKRLSKTTNTGPEERDIQQQLLKSNAELKGSNMENGKYDHFMSNKLFY